ncbi:MAG: rRNA pseudouridine synthase [Desulfamplus sp.]|nr:rRNA pseudouridine synthase [Desulfamplus sp.]
MRLQKFLSQAGICSRRKGEKYISDGLVTINGIKVTHPGIQVDTDVDMVCFRGDPVELLLDSEKIYIALNKPAGVVTSCSHKGEKIVLDMIDIPHRIYPVGRLDKDSSGLLLLTNDGELHNRLSHPSHNHEKEYVVTTVNPISRGALGKMAAGIVLDGKKTRKATVTRLGPFKFNIVLKQGLNRQIRRMVQKTGNSVDTLKRVRMGNIRLDSLKEGEWRYLTRDEVTALYCPLISEHKGSMPRVHG